MFGLGSSMAPAGPSSPVSLFTNLMLYSMTARRGRSPVSPVRQKSLLMQLVIVRILGVMQQRVRTIVLCRAPSRRTVLMSLVGISVVCLAVAAVDVRLVVTLCVSLDVLTPVSRVTKVFSPR